MSATVFGLETYPPLNVAGTLIEESFVGIAGQTVYDLTTFTYAPGTSSIQVYINGQRQWWPRDYTETSPSRFTLAEGVIAGDNVDVVGFPVITFIAYPALNTLGDYVNDAAAAIGGVIIGGMYRTGSALKVRIA